ncbi:hypothetical protein EDD16DRAFT_1565083 [Pisolithus croceorrhizus]|nr:hypothetical protein EDD16DRAFT_1565083 [Pisolithus croceorrhizus]
MCTFIDSIVASYLVVWCVQTSASGESLVTSFPTIRLSYLSHNHGGKNAIIHHLCQLDIEGPLHGSPGQKYRFKSPERNDDASEGQILLAYRSTVPL